MVKGEAVFTSRLLFLARLGLGLTLYWSRDWAGSSWMPSGLSGAPAAPPQDGKMTEEKEAGLLSGVRGDITHCNAVCVGVSMLTAYLCCEMQASVGAGPVSLLTVPST